MKLLCDLSLNSIKPASIKQDWSLDFEMASSSSSRRSFSFSLNRSEKFFQLNLFFSPQHWPDEFVFNIIMRSVETRFYSLASDRKLGPFCSSPGCHHNPLFSRFACLLCINHRWCSTPPGSDTLNEQMLLLNRKWKELRANIGIRPALRILN